jgi:hypothetical protein
MDSAFVCIFVTYDVMNWYGKEERPQSRGTGSLFLTIVVEASRKHQSFACLLLTKLQNLQQSGHHKSSSRPAISYRYEENVQ